MNARDELLKRAELLEPWFYDFDIGEGKKITSKLPSNVRGIHETRLAMVLTATKTYFGDRLPNIRCLDVGCHEGFFSFEMAKIAKNVKGLDIRRESVEKAELIRTLKDIDNVEFDVSDCYRLASIVSEPYELTLFLGVLYHLDNPIGALRSVSEVTKEICILETQIIDDVHGKTEWGSQTWYREYKGTFALIDESAEYDAGSTEAGSYRLSLCPSWSALRIMLEAVGFKQIERVSAPAGGYEQHVRGKRVVVAAIK